MSQVNLKCLASKLGLARSTVSRALRDDPLIAATTRERVKRAAAESGYSANPYLSVLMAHLREGTSPSQSPVLAFLNSYRSRDGWRNYKPMVVALQGATERARELGFELQEFWLGEAGMTPNRLRAVLDTRGIRAVILGAPEHPSEAIQFETEGLAAVAIDLDPGRRLVHRSTADYLANTTIALTALRDRGYRRIGLAIDRRMLDYMRTLPRMAFLEFEQSLPRADRTGYWVDSYDNVPSFAAWLLDAKPDCILTANLGPQSWLQPLGFRIPHDIGVAQLDPHFAGQPLSGIDGRFEVVGRNAVDLLVTRIHRNEFTSPQDPMQVMTQGVWVDGSTTRRSDATPKGDPYDDIRLQICGGAILGDQAAITLGRSRLRERFYGTAFDLASRPRASEMVPLSLASVANTAFHTPELPPRFNKLACDLQPGPHVLRGIPWNLPHGSLSGPATTITLNAFDSRTGRTEPPLTRSIPIGFRLRAAYFLHLAFFVWAPDSAGQYTYVYADGARHSVDLLPFWPNVVAHDAAVYQDAWHALPQYESATTKPLPICFLPDPLRLSGFFYAYEFRNPRPKSVVRAVEIRGNPDSTTKLLIAAITALRFPGSSDA